MWGDSSSGFLDHIRNHWTEKLKVIGNNPTIIFKHFNVPFLTALSNVSKIVRVKRVKQGNVADLSFAGPSAICGEHCLSSSQTNWD